jgi:hypothetical protein
VKSGLLMIVPIYAKVSIIKVPYKQKQSVLQHDASSDLKGIKFALVKAKDKISKPQSMTASNGSKTSWQSPQIKANDN